MKPHASKACRAVRFSWVQIPPSPVFVRPWRDYARQADDQVGRLEFMKKLFLAALLFIFSFFNSAILSAVEFSDVLELRADNPVFSPNGDGLQDKLFFTPVLKSDLDVIRWRLEIYTSSGKLIQRYTGAGFSSLIQWDGKDRKGNVVSEGSYQANLMAWGSGFKIKSTSRSIFVDNTPPFSELKVSTLSSIASYIFTPSVQDNGEIDRWQFQILGVRGNTVYLDWSTGPVCALAWDGRDRTSNRTVPSGSYKAVFQAWDTAGNEGTPAFSDFSVVVAPLDEVKDLVKSLKPLSTPVGLLVQLDSKRIFFNSKGRHEIRKSALPLLNEAALLINSYPEAQVRLDGYSFAFNQSSVDRDMSSRYAWDLYSYFVKQGNVKASRFTVRGRGRVAPEDRLKSKPPYLRNGIEVILVEYEGGW